MEMEIGICRPTKVWSQRKRETCGVMYGPNPSAVKLVHLHHINSELVSDCLFLKN